MALSPGFASPVRDAQACFRALLDAAARPGTIATLRVPGAAPEMLPPAMAALALTLLDTDTPLWLDEAARPATAWLRFHCGCRMVAAPEDAAFLFARTTSLPPLATLAAGIDEYPDRGATAVIAVDQLGTGTALRLAGPGIDGHAILRVTGLPEGFVAQRAVNHRLFPRGVDVVLIAGERAVFLPRSTSVEEG